MAGPLGRLNNFRLNSKFLRSQLISTADNLGVVVKNNFQNFINPSNSEGSFTINSIPARIGFKKINSQNYPISDLYLLKINDEEIVDYLKKRNPSAFN